MIPLSRAVGPPDNREPITDPPKDGFAGANNQRNGAATISAFQRFSLSVFSTSAFTLIELIVVMLIIAALVALVLTATANVFERAKKVQAKNDVTQIVTAVNGFYTEYGR